MNFLKNIFNDLVDKRLWPLALLLIVALVAVPKLLGSSSSDDVATDIAPPTPQPSSNADKTRTGVIALAGSEIPLTLARSQEEKTDPFRRTRAPKTATTADSGSSGGGAEGGGGGTTTVEEPLLRRPERTRSLEYAVTIEFGKSGNLRTYRNITRLTPLPSADQPWFVYMGLSSNDPNDEQKVTFLLSTQADVNGDGACVPSRERCERISLGIDETQYFDVPSGTGGVTQYELRVRSVTARMVDSGRAAAAARRESKAGREVLRSLLESDPSMLDGMKYSVKSGLLELTAKPTKSGK